MSAASAGARAPVRVRCAAVSVAVACSNGCSDRRAPRARASRTWRSGTDRLAHRVRARGGLLRGAAPRVRLGGVARHLGRGSPRAAAARRPWARAAAAAACPWRGARARGRAGGSAATTAPRRSAGRLPCRVSCCSARAVRSTDRVRPRRMIILGSMLARSLRSSSMQGRRRVNCATLLSSARIWAEGTSFTRTASAEPSS